MSNKIAIVHFNIIEKYPPVMNFIYDTLEENPSRKIIVFTTKNTTTYTTPLFPNTKIYRFGTLSSNPVRRYFSYIWFNLMSSIILLMYRVDIIIFETLSVFPLWFVSKINKSKKGHIHYHEYMSKTERNVSSVYLKVLFELEDQLLKKHPCSHTNEDRKRLFLKEKPFLKSEMVEVRPNMPPKSWWNKYGQFKEKSSNESTRLVYIGACDNQTMYVKEVLDWVRANQNKLELTIISHQLNKQTEDLIACYDTKAIRVMKPIDYYELPKELIKHDIGLVLYKGHIPNFVYNIPNKVYEYLSCGLEVMVDIKLLSTANLTLSKIKVVNFEDLKSFSNFSKPIE